MVLEVSNPKSSCQQRWLFLDSPREEAPRASLSASVFAGNPWHFLASRCITPVSAPSYTPLPSLGLCALFRLLFRVHPHPLWSHLDPSVITPCFWVMSHSEVLGRCKFGGVGIGNYSTQRLSTTTSPVWGGIRIHSQIPTQGLNIVLISAWTVSPQSRPHASASSQPS